MISAEHDQVVLALLREQSAGHPVGRPGATIASGPGRPGKVKPEFVLMNGILSER
jgi:hypothetical protein